MPLASAVGFRICWVASVLVLASLHAADPTTATSLEGLRHDEVLRRLGEPRSQITVGSRLVMNFDSQRVVLRDGVVVAVERIVQPPVRQPAVAAPAPAPEPASTAPTAGAPGPGPSAAPASAPAAVLPTTSVAPATVSVAPVTPPVAPATQMPVAAASPSPAAAAPGTAAPAAVAAAETPPPPPPKLAIKLVRPPAAGYTRPPPGRQTTTPASTAGEPAPTTPASPAPRTVVAESTRVTDPRANAPAVGPTTTTPSALSPVLDATTAIAVASASPATGVAPGAAAVVVAPAVPEAKAADEKPAAETPAEKKKKAAKAARRHLDATDQTPDEPLFTRKTYVMAFLLVGAGVAYFTWRSRQRQLELAATAVTRTPFAAQRATTGGGGPVFTSDFVTRLEWKRFEELVAAYYSKTGVVATRTKSGPSAPVHIKISWKGESRPFALVQCISHSTTLIDAKPLQELVAVLGTEDIRRGYVVTTGKFNIPARDYAEEKHITLLPGDIFLEKLNALPDAARIEIMSAINSGDTATPSCPKCDAKMVRSAEDPAMWRCPTHADQTVFMPK